MAKKGAVKGGKKKRTVSGKRGTPGQKRAGGTDRRGVVGIVVTCVGLLSLAGQFIPSDGGFLRACNDLTHGLGGTLCLLLPLVVCWAGLALVFSREKRLSARSAVCGVLLFLFVEALLQLFQVGAINTALMADGGAADYPAFLARSFLYARQDWSRGGGLLGGLLAWPLWKALDVWGGVVVLVFASAIVLMVMTGLSTGKVGMLLSSWLDDMRSDLAERREERDARREIREDEALAREGERAEKRFAKRAEREAADAADDFTDAPPPEPPRAKKAKSAKQPPAEAEPAHTAVRPENHHAESARPESVRHETARPEAARTAPRRAKLRALHPVQEAPLYIERDDAFERVGIDERGESPRRRKGFTMQEAEEAFLHGAGAATYSGYGDEDAQAAQQAAPGSQSAPAVQTAQAAPMSQVAPAAQAAPVAQVAPAAQAAYDDPTAAAYQGAPAMAAQAAPAAQVTPAAQAAYGAQPARGAAANVGYDAGDAPDEDGEAGGYVANDGYGANNGYGVNNGYGANGYGANGYDANGYGAAGGYHEDDEDDEDSAPWDDAPASGGVGTAGAVAAGAVAGAAAMSAARGLSGVSGGVAGAARAAAGAFGASGGAGAAGGAGVAGVASAAGSSFGGVPSSIPAGGVRARRPSPVIEDDEDDGGEVITQLRGSRLDGTPLVMPKKDAHEMPKAQEEYVYPPLDLLERSQSVRNPNQRAKDEAGAQKLLETLESFGVQAKLTHVTHGPAITRYEVQPAPGVKVSRIVNLVDDIALNMASDGVRIEAPIPGKPAVGIEIPNETIETVSLRDVLESPEMQREKSPTSVALGKGISGAPVIADMAKMPHVLIAGATGSGKSVCINTIINSIIYRASPREVRLILIDPKVVELSVYNGIPHLLVPVVTDPKKASAALSWAVVEMEHRYKRFETMGVRDIRGYNNAIGEGEEPMSKIIVIIDELADLMMVAPGEVEESICRLAQLARAAGIHLVIATQRPSVNVITGVIKANIPSRIAFAVSSQIDSRTILDSGGAEKLLGKGDMLYAPQGAGKPTRVQGCFVSDEEVQRIVDYVRGRHEAEYSEDVIEQLNSAAEEEKAEKGDAPGGGEAMDEMLQKAIELAIDAGQVSISMLQRRLRVGYARAGRLVDEMTLRGITAEAEGPTKPRTVLVTREQWRQMQENMD